MKEHASLSQQQSAAAIEFPADRASSALPATGFWTRFVSRVRSWFTIPRGYEDESGFHYGEPPSPRSLPESTSAGVAVFTDQAVSAMTYPTVLPQSISEVPTKFTEPATPSLKS